MRSAPSLLLALVLAACAATRPAARDDDAPFVRRAFAPGVLSLKGISYSGYRTGQSPDTKTYPSEAEILEDLQLVVRGGWGLIRLFDSGEHARRVLAVIDREKLDLKVMLGAWIAGPAAKHDAANRAEIERTAAFARQYPQLVVALSVGNETLDDWSAVRTPAEDLAGYIRLLRGQTTLPVTTDDAWQPFSLVTVGKTSYADCIVVLRAIDFVSVHVYAFAEAHAATWDWKQEAVPEAARGEAMMAAAVAYTKSRIRLLRGVLVEQGLDMPIVIGETGWKSKTVHTKSAPPDDAIEVNMSHPMNQKLFHDAMNAWMYGDARDADTPDAAIFFEAFDEPWKDQWGDDGWGVFDVQRQAKPVIWDRFPDRKPATAEAYAPSDAVSYRP